MLVSSNISIFLSSKEFKSLTWSMMGTISETFQRYMYGPGESRPNQGLVLGAGRKVC